MDSFANRIKRIEEISKILESDDLELEESIKIYKEGLKLIKENRKILENAKLKITQIEQDNG